MVIDFFGAGAVVGEMAVLSGEVRNASIVCETDVQVGSVQMFSHLLSLSIKQCLARIFNSTIIVLINMYYIVHAHAHSLI